MPRIPDKAVNGSAKIVSTHLKTKGTTSEFNLHKAVADFLNWILLPPAVWTTFPAGWTAMRTGAAGRLKACGLKAGMPDILVFYNSKTIGVELKTGTKVSPEQCAMFNKLHAAGVFVSVVRSIDDVERTLRTYKIPMRKFNYAQDFKAPESRRSQEPPQGATAP